MRPAIVVLFVLAAAPARAQRSEVALLAGYTTAGGLENRAPTLEDLEIADGLAWGLQAGHFFGPHLGVEATWMRQESGLTFAQGTDAVDLFDANVDQVLGSVAYRFRNEDAALRPFVFAGLGAAFFSAAHLDGETKFAWTMGAGLKWSATRRVGARLQAQYLPTRLSDEEADFCDPFGFCQDSLQQFQFTAGVVVAF